MTSYKFSKDTTFDSVSDKNSKWTPDMTDDKLIGTLQFDVMKMEEKEIAGPIGNKHFNNSKSIDSFTI
jgi:hypothetical protein